MVVKDILGNVIRLTDERKTHILEHKEMENQLNKISETLLSPEAIIASKYEPDVRLYYRFYQNTPVTEKYLVVIVKITFQDCFILISFFTDKIKRGRIIWKS